MAKDEKAQAEKASPAPAPVTAKSKAAAQAEKAEELWSKARKAVYVDRDGTEYPATVCPLPLTKGAVIDVPQLADPAAELARIMSLPVPQQMKEIIGYQKSLGTPAKALLINGTIKRLELCEGELCQTTQHGSEYIPAPDLLIQYEEGSPPIFKQRVLHEKNVARAAKGRKQTPFFRFVTMLLLMLLSFSASAVDSGGVSEGKQVWAGRKIFTDRVSENKAVILCNEGTDFGGGNAANAVRVKIAYRTWATGF